MASSSPNASDDTDRRVEWETGHIIEAPEPPTTMADDKSTPTTTSPTGDGGGRIVVDVDARRIAGLQNDLLDAASNAADEVIGLVSRLRSLSQDVDISPRDQHGNTPLHLLVLNKRAPLKTVTDLLSVLSVEDVNAMNYPTHDRRSDESGQNNTALHFAALHGAEEIVRALLAFGADMMIPNRGRNTALHMACSRGHVGTASILCRHAAQHDLDMDVRGYAGETPLHYACAQTSRVGIIPLLLSYGDRVDAEKESDRGMTPLMRAAFFGCESAISVLLQHGVNVNYRNNSNGTALMVASDMEKDGAVCALLVAGADPNLRDGQERTALSLAVGRKHSVGIVHMLLEGEADVNTRDRRKRTPLHEATDKGTDAIVTMLLAHNSDVDQRDLGGQTPLHVACAQGKTDMADGLLLHGADPMALDNLQRSPLYLASSIGAIQTVRMLLVSGRVLIDAPDFEGRSPLHVACSMRQDELSDFRGSFIDTILGLMAFGGNKSLRTNRGETILHLAAKEGLGDRVRLLLYFMASSDKIATTNDGKTALDLAAAGRHRDAVSVMLRYPLYGFGEGGIDRDLLSWAADDERTHRIVRMKLMDNLTSPLQWAPVQESWSALDLATYLGDYVVVQKLLHGISDPLRRIRKVQGAMRILDASQGEGDGRSTTPTDTTLNNTRAATRTLGGSETRAGREDDLHEDANEPLFRYQAVRTLLRVAENSARTPRVEADFYPPRGSVDPGIQRPAVIFDFYARGTTSTVKRHEVPVQSVIYDEGPQKIMLQKRQGEKKARAMVEKLEWPDDEQSQALREEVLLELTAGRDEDLRMRWIHLPANNIKWMDDLMTRILYDRADPNSAGADPTGSGPGNRRHGDRKDFDDEEWGPGIDDFDDEGRRLKEDVDRPRNHPELPRLKAFFGKSWTEFPDSSSPSRVMKARCVKRPTAPERKNTPPRARGHVRSSASLEDVPPFPYTSDRTPAVPTKKRNFEPLALYMPYLTLATQNASLTADSTVPCTDNSHAVHGSRTLDEFYYQFASDREYSQADIDKRNRDQVVTRWLHRGEDINELMSWVILRVDQLWLWIVAPDVIITSSTHRIDGRPDVLSNTVFGHLQKGHSQPKTVHELANLITTLCIRFYDQVQEAAPIHKSEEGRLEQRIEAPDTREGGGLTIQEIFSNSINKVALEEVELFETFTKDEEISNDDAARALVTKQVTVVKPARLLGEVKDLQDEINILRAIVTQQQRVLDTFLGEDPSEWSITGQIIARIDEMDKYAARIYSAVHATLGLEQNKIAIGYSNEAVRQGRNLMAFTATTILFLPLSFLASLFALDVTTFPHKENGDVSFAPEWIFPLICKSTYIPRDPSVKRSNKPAVLISAAFWIIVVLYAFHDRLDGLTQVQLFQNAGEWGRKITKRRPQSVGPSAQSAEADPKPPALRIEPGHKTGRMEKIRQVWRRRHELLSEDEVISAVEIESARQDSTLIKRRILTS